MRLTHVGGPTVLLEVAGWRILTDPTFDPPGRRYGFGWGTSSRKTDGPARSRRPTSEPSTWSCSATTITPTTSTTSVAQVLRGTRGGDATARQHAGSPTRDRRPAALADHRLPGRRQAER